jgi:hypothetical protein
MPITPCFDPTTGASGGAAPGGGSTPVTPPAAQSQTQPQGGSFAAVTFGAFTDSGGRISSYSASRTNVVGSGTISGSGLGPYSFSGTADGEVITVELDALDASANVLATAVFTGSIAGAPPSSELLQTWDFRTADTGALSGSGNITSGGGATVIVGYNVFVQTGSPTATTDITAAGLRVNRSNANSVSGIALDLSGVLGLVDDARDTLLFFVHFASVTNTTMVNNQNVGVNVSNSNSSISSTPTRGLFLQNTSVSNLAVRVREYDGSVTTVTKSNIGGTWPTSGTALLEVSGSRVFAGWVSSANPARSAVPVATAGISSGDTAPAAAPSSTPFAHLQIAPNPQVGGDIQLTISHIEVYRLAAGAT